MEDREFAGLGRAEGFVAAHEIGGSALRAVFSLDYV
jgi:hypothetical protein